MRTRDQKRETRGYGDTPEDVVNHFVGLDPHCDPVFLAVREITDEDAAGLFLKGWAQVHLETNQALANGDLALRAAFSDVYCAVISNARGEGPARATNGFGPTIRPWVRAYEQLTQPQQ
jgi:hypothetical protein